MDQSFAPRSEGRLRAAGADPTADADDRIDLRSILSALWRRKWLPIGLALLGAVVIGAVVTGMPPRFTARASVMLDPGTLQVLTSAELVGEATLNNPLLDSEAAQMRSNVMLERVVRSIDPAALAALDPAIEAPGLLDRAKGLARSALGALSGSDPAASAADPGATGADLAAQDAEQAVLRRIAALRRSLRVAREGESYVISVWVETGDAALSALLANAVTDQYIASQSDSRAQVIRGATDWLAERVEAMGAEVEATEAAVEQYKVDQIAEQGATLETIAQQLTEVSAQLAIAGADKATAEAQLAQVEEAVRLDAQAAADLVSSPFIETLREELSQLRREDAALGLDLGPEHPIRLALAEDIQRVTADLDREVERAVEALRRDVGVALIREGSLTVSLEALEGRYAELSRGSLRLRQIEREADSVRGAYESMLARLNETQSLERLQQASARVIERARPPAAPSAPRPLLFAGLAGVGGLSLGTLLALVLAFATPGAQTRGELERALGLAVLTAIPRLPRRAQARVLEQLLTRPQDLFAERVRQLRTALDLRRGRTAPQAIAVTSAMSGEGKSTTALALAQMSGLTGRRTLLLDLDLRRTNLARQLRLEALSDGGPGDLGAWIEGRCDLGAAIRRDPRAAFDALALDAPRPALADALDADRLASLVAELKSRYATVVIDSPPLLAASEAMIIAHVADIRLLLVRQATTPRRAAQEAASRLADLGGLPALAVLTMADLALEGGGYGHGSRAHEG